MRHVDGGIGVCVVGVGTPSCTGNGPMPDAAALVALMGQDKKVLDGQIRFILARAIGEAFVSSDVEADDVVAFLSDQG